MEPKFKVGDVVILKEHEILPNFGKLWVPDMDAMVGKTVKLSGIPYYEMGRLLTGVAEASIVWTVKVPGSLNHLWRESSMTLVSSNDDTPPTLRPLSKTETPEWLISRAACLEPNQCPKCGAPRSPTNPCEYHEPKPVPTPKVWAFGRWW